MQIQQAQLDKDDLRYIDKYKGDKNKCLLYRVSRNGRIHNQGDSRNYVEGILRKLLINHLQFTLNGQHEYDFIERLREREPIIPKNDVVKKIADRMLDGKQKFPFNFGEWLNYTNKEEQYDVHHKDFHLIGITESVLTNRACSYIESSVVHNRRINQKILRAFDEIPDFTNNIKFSNGFKLVVESSLPQSHSLRLYKKEKVKPIYSLCF